LLTIITWNKGNGWKMNLRDKITFWRAGRAEGMSDQAIAAAWKIYERIVTRYENVTNDRTD
jgi:hypothetical protein